LALPGLASACPNCAEAMPGSRNASAIGDDASLASSGGGGGLADGFYYSILFMLAVPYLLAGAGGYAIYRAVKRHQGVAVPRSPVSG
jgi:hypothetical protein